MAVCSFRHAQIIEASLANDLLLRDSHTWIEGEIPMSDHALGETVGEWQGLDVEVSEHGIRFSTA